MPLESGFFVGFRLKGNNRTDFGAWQNYLYDTVHFPLLLIPPSPHFLPLTLLIKLCGPEITTTAFIASNPLSTSYHSFTDILPVLNVAFGSIASRYLIPGTVEPSLSGRY